MKKRSNYVNLLLQMALTDFKLKYSGSILGYVWSLVKPLLLFGVLYVVFTFFFELGKGIKNYPVYLLIGIIFWTFFAESTMSAMHAIVDRGDLIRKVNFPRVIIVLAAIITAVLTFFLNLIIVFAFLIISKLIPTYTLLLLIPLILEFTVLIIGVSLILATLFTKLRDFAHIWEVGLQIGFYATPILYPISYIPQKLDKVLMLSPVAQIIQDARWALISRDVVRSWDVLGFPLSLGPIALTFLIFAFGIWFFSVSAKNFAEEI